jgi:hypothetical protein
VIALKGATGRSDAEVQGLKQQLQNMHSELRACQGECMVLVARAEASKLDGAVHAVMSSRKAVRHDEDSAMNGSGLGRWMPVRAKKQTAHDPILDGSPVLDQGKGMLGPGWGVKEGDRTGYPPPPTEGRQGEESRHYPTRWLPHSQARPSIPTSSL